MGSKDKQLKRFQVTESVGFIPLKNNKATIWNKEHLVKPS